MHAIRIQRTCRVGLAPAHLSDCHTKSCRTRGEEKGLGKKKIAAVGTAGHAGIPLTYIFLIIIFCLSACPLYAFENQIGTIERVQGTVKVLRSDDRIEEGRVELGLLAGDMITTEKNASVWFALENTGSFKIGEDSQISIDELSSGGDDDQPRIRLVLGFLWSKLKKIKKTDEGFKIHTPTAVIGIRGTEFDTVVSIDAASLVAVDEGIVELKTDDKKVSLDKGMSSSVEMEGGPSLPKAIGPKEQRDWQAWRRQRMKGMLRKLPRMAPRFQKKFQRAVVRSKNFTDSVNQAADEIRNNIRDLHAARAEMDRNKFANARQNLRTMGPQFNQKVRSFRRALNRVRVMGDLSGQIGRFYKNNKESYSVQQQERVESSLKDIALRRRQLKMIYQRTIINIRETIRELRKLRMEMQKMRGNG